MRTTLRTQVDMPRHGAFGLPLTGSIGWEAYDSLLQGCRDEAPDGALIRLRFLNAATSLSDLRLPGLHSIRIDDRYRVCFEWQDGDAYNVEIVD